MTEFFKYPSLTNHYAIGKEFRIIDRLNDFWYSTEKIHGANASYILTSNGNEYFAKRSGIIDFESSDKQFNQLPNVVSEAVKSGAKKVLENYQSDKVIVYGEYYGKGVQSMKYDIIKDGKKDFRVFNIFVQKSEDSYMVLGYEEMKSFIDKSALVPILEVDTLRNLLSKDQDEKSALGGFKEGDVYQPISSYIIDENNRFVGVKRKTDRYLEVEKVPKKTKSSPSWSIQEISIREELGRYITENRLNNVLSHGDLELIPQNIGKIMLAVKEDAIEEFKKETEIEYDEGTDFMKLVNGWSKDIAMLIKNKIQKESMSIING